ncbi:MAG TPA: DUF4412 domain-containing protein [Gemmatimonadota bacterium]|jgi:hypothetical protein
MPALVMRVRPLRRRWFLAAVAIAAPAAAAAAAAQETYVEARTHTDEVSVMGRTVPARDGTTRTWIGEDRIAVQDEAAGNTVILRADLGRIYVVMPEARTYYESPIPFQFPPEMQQMMQVLNPQVTVTPTDETRVVNEWTARLTKVHVTMMGQDVAMDMWMSPDVGVPTERVRALTQAMFSANPAFSELGAKMASIEGYPVRVESRVTVMGSSFGSWQEVQTVETREAPPGTFEVPAGYEKTDRLPTAGG